MRGARRSPWGCQFRPNSGEASRQARQHLLLNHALHCRHVYASGRHENRLRGMIVTGMKVFQIGISQTGYLQRIAAGFHGISGALEKLLTDAVIERAQRIGKGIFHFV